MSLSIRPRRIVDLIAKYKLERTIRDIYVEGNFDANILRMFFRELDCPNVSIIPVEIVDIPVELLQEHNQTPGRKNEVLVLADEVFSSCGEVRSFTGVVDADADRLLRVANENPLVFMTDYTCMEMYWLEKFTIERFFKWLKFEDRTAEHLHVDVVPAARELFLLRSALTSRKIPAALIPLRKYCTLTGTVVNFDSERYRKSVLISAGYGALESDVAAEIEKLRNEIAAEARHSLHGHDLIDMMFVAYKDRLGDLGIKEIEAANTVIKMSFPISTLHEHQLFRDLLDRVKVKVANLT